MKGRTRCPECDHEFTVDAPDHCRKLDVACPNCQHDFTITLTSSKTSSPNEPECSWEEHGEPRKTILSSIKPKTDKPGIIALLLVAAFITGVVTAGFSEAFIETSTDIMAGAGLKGSLNVEITNISGDLINTGSLTLDNEAVFTIRNGTYVAEGVTPGFKTIKISVSGYQTISQEVLVFPIITMKHSLTMEAGNQDKTIPFETIGCSLILLLLSIFPLLAAVYAYKRKHFDVAIAGSLIGLCSLGFFLVEFVLCLIAFLLLIMAKEEFDNGEKGKTF